MNEFSAVSMEELNQIDGGGKILDAIVAGVKTVVHDIRVVADVVDNVLQGTPNGPGCPK